MASSINIHHNNIKNVYYINLEERVDRKRQIEKQLNTLKWKYQRFNAIKAKSGRVGCSLSHLKLLEMAKEKKLPYIVILEDDIMFTSMDEFKWLLKEFLKENLNFDVYLLAGNLRQPIEKVTPNILKVFRSFTTTGYIVRSHYYDTMIQNIKEGIQGLMKNPENGLFAIDTYWMKLQQSGNWYISYPRTVTQQPDYSDIEKRMVNNNNVMLDTKLD